MLSSIYVNRNMHTVYRLPLNTRTSFSWPPSLTHSVYSSIIKSHQPLSGSCDHIDESCELHLILKQESQLIIVQYLCYLFEFESLQPTSIFQNCKCFFTHHQTVFTKDRVRQRIPLGDSEVLEKFKCLSPIRSLANWAPREEIPAAR